MTYVITPHGTAFEIDPKALYEMDYLLSGTINDMQPSVFFIRHNTRKISPEFRVWSYVEDDEMTYEDCVEVAKADCILWLRDFLITIVKQPTVIQCTLDGEMFTS